MMICLQPPPSLHAETVNGNINREAKSLLPLLVPPAANITPHGHGIALQHDDAIVD
jgi:hypothetical protein